MIKKTPLYDVHIKYNGNITEFAGYYLPMTYESGVIAEHNAVRQSAGIFDVSHMGEFVIGGKNAQEALNKLLTNDISSMNDRGVRYSPLPNERGGAVDDVLIYRFSAEKFMLVVNAANRQKDEEWIKSRLPKDVWFEDASDGIAQIALQGPRYMDIMKRLCLEDALPEKYYTFKDGVDVGGVKCLVSRTGYTGESGCELYFSPADAIKLFELLMSAGKDFGLMPAGLGARDTLRLEAGMPLYGHELSEVIPLSEVDLDFAIKLNHDFIGRAAIEAHTPEYTRLGARVLKGIARQGDKVFCGEALAGEVTSGTHSPTLGYPIAVLRLRREYIGKPLWAEVRGRRLELQAMPMPFYKR